MKLIFYGILFQIFKKGTQKKKIRD
jgi:hypothetical protein